jgi:hypothetical protein
MCLCTFCDIFFFCRRWDDLDNFLARYDDPGTSNAGVNNTRNNRFNIEGNSAAVQKVGSMLAASSSGFLAQQQTQAQVGAQSQPRAQPQAGAQAQVTLPPPVLDSDCFQLSIGKLLLNLHRSDRSSFEIELENVRRQVSFLPIRCSIFLKLFPMLCYSFVLVTWVLHVISCLYNCSKLSLNA